MKIGPHLFVLNLLLGESIQESQFECGKVKIKHPQNYNTTVYSYPGQWPWMGIVYHRKPDRALEYACGCTLISDRHVITSEICVKTENGSLVDSDVLFVRLGSHDHNLLHFGSARHRKVRKIYLPNGDYENEIVILEFRKKVKLNDHVQPICVGEYEFDYIKFMVGWGAVKGNKLLRTFKKTEENCNIGGINKYNEYYNLNEICNDDCGSIEQYFNYLENKMYVSTVVDCTRTLFDTCKVDNEVNRIAIKSYIPWIGAITNLEYLQMVRKGRNFDPSLKYPQLLPLHNCGHIFVAHNDRDRNAQLYEYPWIASVGYKRDEMIGDEQPGALISYRYVLTAAECVYNSYNETITYVKLGEHDLYEDPDCNAIDENDCAPPVRYYDVEYIVIHQDYDILTRVNTMYNIALIRTADVIAYEDHIHPVCLPVTEELRQLKPSEFVFAGWNMLDEDGISSSILQHATFSKCFINQTQIAQSGLLMCPKIDDFIWWYRILGAPVGTIVDFNGMRFVQFAINLSVFNNEKYYHTNVAYYMDWIVANMKE